MTDATASREAAGALPPGSALPDAPLNQGGGVRAGKDRVARAMRRRGDESRFWWLVPTLYIVFLLLPIYWLINMSFKTNQEIIGGMTLFPHEPTLRNYRIIFSDPSWYWGYLNSIIYVLMNTVLSVAVALPASYAFSRSRFLGPSGFSSSDGWILHAGVLGALCS